MEASEGEPREEEATDDAVGAGYSLVGGPAALGNGFRAPHEEEDDEGGEDYDDDEEEVEAEDGFGEFHGAAVGPNGNGNQWPYDSTEAPGAGGDHNAVADRALSMLEMDYQATLRAAPRGPEASPVGGADEEEDDLPESDTPWVRDTEAERREEEAARSAAAAATAARLPPLTAEKRARIKAIMSGFPPPARVTPSWAARFDWGGLATAATADPGRHGVAPAPPQP